MRQALLALAIWATLHSAAAAQNTAWAQKLFAGPASHDFGTCPHGAKLKHRFPMKNIYAVPLQITDLRTSCRCLTATASKGTLKPQEEGYIDILMDAATFKGPKTITVYVTVGPEFVSTAALVISANARSDVTFNPGELDFGLVPTGQTPTRVIDVEYAGVLDWQVVEVVKNKNAPFDVSIRETYRQTGRLLRNGKVGYQMLVTLKPGAASGPFRQEIPLKTNDPQSPVLTVEVSGNVQASLAVLPSSVNFGALKLGQSESRKVIVRGSRAFRIASVEGAGGGVTTDLPQSVSASHVIEVRCQPTKAGRFERQLRIRTDQGETVTLTVQGIATN
jgi:hypothetical protein